MALMEDIADEAVAFAHLETVRTPGNDARRVLSAVLQYRQSVVDRLVDRAFAYHADNATH
jgi:hypothetical protein